MVRGFAMFQFCICASLLFFSRCYRGAQFCTTKVNTVRLGDKSNEDLLSVHFCVRLNFSDERYRFCLLFKRERCRDKGGVVQRSG